MKKKSGAVIRGLITVVLLVIALFPIYWLVAMAVRPASEMTGHISVIPQTLTLEHFHQLFTEKGFGRAILNSLQTTGFSLVLSLAFGLCAAYIIARHRFRFGMKKPLTYWVLLVRVLPPVAFTIPLYTMDDVGEILNRVKAQNVQIYEVELDRGREEKFRNPSAVLYVRLTYKQPHTQILSAISELESVYTIEEI